MSKGQEERKLEQAEASTKVLWQALKKPKCAGFVFEKNVPMLPAHPILDRRVMRISADYRLSQIGGHNQSKQPKKKSHLESTKYIVDDNWKLSLTDEQQRKKKFGKFGGIEKHFSVKKILKVWEKSISCSELHRVRFGFGPSAQVVKLLSACAHGGASVSPSKTKNANRVSTSSDVIEIDRPFNIGTSNDLDGFKPSKDPDIDIVSDEEDDHNYFYPSEQEEEEHEGASYYERAKHKNTKNYLDQIFGDRRYPKYDFLKKFEDILFESDDDFGNDEDERSCKSEEAVDDNHSNYANYQLQVSANLLNTMDSNKECSKMFEVLNRNEPESLLLSPKVSSQTSNVCSKEKHEITSLQELGSNVDGDISITDNANNHTRQNSYQDAKASDDIRNEKHESELVQPCTTNDENNVNQDEIDLLHTCHPSDCSKASTEEPQTSFCFDLPSQDSSTSSSEDSDSSSSDSNLSFTLQINDIREGSMSNNKVSEPATEHHNIESFAADPDNQNEPASIQNESIMEENAIPSTQSILMSSKSNPDSPSNIESLIKPMMDSQGSSSVPPESPLISNYNGIKRNALAIIDTQSQISPNGIPGSLDLTGTPDQVARHLKKRAEGTDNLTDTPSSSHKKHRIERKLQSNLREDLSNTPNSSDKNNRRKSKMKKLVKKKVKGKSKHSLRCHFLDLEAVASSDDGQSDDEEEDSEEEPSQDSFINDSSQLGYSQGASLTQDHALASHWQMDAQQEREESFSTPIFNRRQQQQDLSQANLSSAEKGIGKMHFIKSVVDHIRQGGDVNDIEKGYQSILNNRNFSQDKSMGDIQN